MSKPTTGYINGSDVLVDFGGGAVGHCTSHTVTYTSETKEHAVKPVASAGYTSGLWAGKTVTKLSISLKIDGLRVYDETEHGFKTGLAQWAKGKSVPVKCFERSGDANPYISGNFVIASIEETAAANDDATYSMTLENDGEVTVDASKLSGEALGANNE